MKTVKVLQNWNVSGKVYTAGSVIEIDEGLFASVATFGIVAEVESSKKTEGENKKCSTTKGKNTSLKN